MSPGSCNNCYLQTIRLEIIYILYMYKQDSTLNNQQNTINQQFLQTHTRTHTQTYIYIYMMDSAIDLSSVKDVKHWTTYTNDFFIVPT